MAISRNDLPKEMTPFGKGAKGAKKPAMPDGSAKANPFAAKAKANPFGGKAKAPAFAEGGAIPAYEGGGHMAASSACPPSKNPLDDGKPSGGGSMRGGGAATKGKKFRGVF